MPAVPLTLLFFLLHLPPATPTPTRPHPHPNPNPNPHPHIDTETLVPTPWPDQFHAVLFMNTSNDLALVDLWYDWPRGRNLNLLRDQSGGPPFYDLEWNNGTSFWFTLEEPRGCSAVQVGVGVLRPDWLHGAQYLGRETVDGFVCDVWTKLEFIWYYEDVETKRPVKWIFYTGRTIHVMTYEVGAVLDDASWQAPVYCFQKNVTAMEERQMENPEMFSFDNSASINRNLIRSQKTLSVGGSLSS